MRPLRLLLSAVVFFASFPADAAVRLAPVVSRGAAAPRSLGRPIVSKPASLAVNHGAAVQASVERPIAATPAPLAEERLLAVESLEALTPAPAQDAESTETIISRNEPLWTGAARRGSSQVDLRAPVAVAAPSGLTAPRSRSMKRAALAVGAALTAAPAAALAAGSPAMQWTDFVPYAQAGLVLLGTSYANRFARWGIDRTMALFGFSDNARMIGRSIASVAVWTGGTVFAFAVGGADVYSFIGAGAVGGLGLALGPARTELENFVAAMKHVMRQPFRIGDFVMLNFEIYRVADLTLRNVVTNRGIDSVGYKEYSDFAGRAITVYRPYDGDMIQPEPAGVSHALIAPFALATKTLTNTLRLTVAMPGRELLKVGISALLSVGLAAYGLPALQGAIDWAWFQSLYPYLHGASVLYVAHSVQKWAKGMITQWGAMTKKPEAVTKIWALAAQMFIYFIGAGIGLSVTNLSWETIGTILAPGGITVGFVIGKVFDDYGRWIYNIASNQIRYGRYVEKDMVRGRVITMDGAYIVLEHSDRSHTFVPHGGTKDFAVIGPEDVKHEGTEPPQPLYPWHMRLGEDVGRVVRIGADGIEISTDEKSGKTKVLAMDELQKQPLRGEVSKK